MKSSVLPLLLSAVLGLSAAAQPAERDLAWQRAQHLQHGINASIWFAQSTRDYSVERLRTFTTADDIALMEKLGFDHVRVSVDATPLLGNNGYGRFGPSRSSRSLTASST